MTLQQMKQRLRDFDPQAKIEVIDLTGTSNHWEVSMQSALFKGLSRIEQHKSVMACFDSELKTGEVHALSIKTQSL
ncbi:MAG: BolA/IbaG family iron-sulfur metabolism protein [Bdellovibrionales bacterium]|nr:BolA/IbaG family iron-sulfur metabolism protein [Bdellovibrionales bacterium]MBL7671634.1 BolA/IbaG family iron-sulfur metabolism protein [Pseudobdellovibrionaceae bacterium]